MKIIAHIQSDFPEKFGLPRQSGLVEELQARIVFEPEYRNIDAFRGIEEFSHLWLIWQFSANLRDGWSPTVRPPRLGGNERRGVFATRSPFRPNPLGLSAVKLVKLEIDAELGPVLYVSGADLMDGTPIYDVKPYIPLADAHPEASAGFSGPAAAHSLQVAASPALLAKLPAEKQQALLGVLAQDPRPAYQHDPERLYGFSFAGHRIRFTVDGDMLTVREIEPLEAE